MTTDSSTIGSSTHDVADRIRGAASTQLSQQKTRATDGLTGLSDTIRQSTQTFRDNNQDTVARYVEMAADRIDQVARHLRDRDIGDLARDVEQFARRQPAAFIGATFMAGMLAARFLKSSAGDGHHRSTTLPAPMPAAVPTPMTGGTR
jgi:hypothetical protein